MYSTYISVFRPFLRLKFTGKSFSKIKSSLQKINAEKGRLRNLQRQNKRLKYKVKSLKTVISTLGSKNLISTACEELLERKFGDVPKQLLNRMTTQSGRGLKYADQLKSFAFTLQFYSAKAYQFVRKNLALPHPSEVRKWYTKLPAEPGFTNLALDAIKAKVDLSEKPVICSVMLDEMSIRKHISWDGKRYQGFVNLGMNSNDTDAFDFITSVNRCL